MLTIQLQHLIPHCLMKLVLIWTDMMMDNAQAVLLLTIHNHSICITAHWQQKTLNSAHKVVKETKMPLLGTGMRTTRGFNCQLGNFLTKKEDKYFKIFIKLLT